MSHFTSSTDYFKCCCLHSLQITSSSLFSTEKVSKYLALNSYIHKAFIYSCWTIWWRLNVKFCSLLFSCILIFLCFILYSLFTVSGDDKGSCFSFLRFIDVAPAEMSNLMLQGTLVRWAFSFHLQISFSLCVCFEKMPDKVGEKSNKKAALHQQGHPVQLSLSKTPNVQ